MIIIGTAAFFLMNMVYNRGIYVKTHPLVLDMEEDVSAEDFIETYDDTEVLVTFVDMPVHQIGKQTVEFVVENKREEVKNIHRHSNGCIKIKQRRRLTVYITSQ